MLNSCCHKTDCTDLPKQFEMTLYNFAPSDVDSISIEVFKGGATGTVRIDSIFTRAYQPVSGSNIFTVYAPVVLEQSYDYRVTLNSTNQVYLLSGFITKHASCNNCLIKIMDEEHITLGSYMVNGMIQYYEDLRIMN
jgi:hypothetical protein